MVAANLLSNELVPLRTSDTGEEALTIMSDFHVQHLPIVNNEQLLGLLSEDDILEHDISEPVGSYSLALKFPHVQGEDHIYEIMSLMAEFHLTVIPVVDSESNYLGMITLDDLLQYFAHIGSFTEPGSIIVLEMHRQDYSLAEIARIVESENAAVLSAFISSELSNDTARIDVTVKVNSQHIHSILATFERFDYHVKASFSERDYSEALKERYDSLMTYLNV
jgi:CBS domain-containing protein